MKLLKRSWKNAALSVLVIVLLALPLAAGAQTTGTSGSNSATATTAQINGISSPKDMAALSGAVEVRGYANVPNFMKWQLDLLPNNDANAAIFLAFGEKAGEFTYSLDTSKLPAGEHSLRLRIVRADSNYDEFFTQFTVGGAKTSTAATASAVKATTTVTSTSAMTATITGGAKSADGATSGMGVTSNGLAAPREGQTLNGKFVVRGFASDPAFMKWQLDLLPGGDATKAAFLSFGESTGVFTYTLDATNLPAGTHALRLRVVRNDSNYNEYITNFTIGKATTSGNTGSATTAPAASGGTTGTTTSSATGGAANQVNGFNAPKDGATVRGSVTITGYASGPGFMKWQLDLLPAKDANQAAFLASGEKAGEFSYTLDTANLPAGEHGLRLRVVRADSNYDEYMIKFTIAK